MDFFRVACERDLEGVVGKSAGGTYTTDGRTTNWVKVKNAAYSQAKVRHELFAARRRLGEGARQAVRYHGRGRTQAGPWSRVSAPAVAPSVLGSP